MEKHDDQQEVTVEVLPQTVTDIIYLTESDLLMQDTSLCTPSEEELEYDEIIEYEIGSVDTAIMDDKDLVLDQSQMFVLLAGDNDLVSTGINEPVFLKVQSENNLTPLDFENGSLFQRLKDEEDDAKEFKCVNCAYKTNSKELLETHKIIHKEYLCEVCKVRFKQASFLAKHFDEKHKASLTCSVCQYASATAKSYLMHQKQHEIEKLHFECNKCQKSFSGSTLLMDHMKTHGNVLLYACNKCDEAFSSTTEVSSHLRVCVLKMKARELKQNQAEFINKHKKLHESSNLLSSLHTTKKIKKKR